MDAEAVRKRTAEVIQILGAPSKPNEPRASRGTYISETPPTTSELDDLFDYIRLRVRYLLFDLEATRRENRYLRQMLERRSNPGEGADFT